MINLRVATIHDLSLLQHWDKQQHVMSAVLDEDWQWAKELYRNPAWREMFIAELNGTPIGVIQIIDPEKEETHYWGDIGSNKRAIDIWIGEAQNLGKGYGTIIMELALARCFEDKRVKEVLIDPLETNKNAIRFYKRLGFQFVEKCVLDGGQCEVYVITRSIFLNPKRSNPPLT